MKVTALKEQVKNPDRVNVFIDGAYSFSLSLGEVIDYKVRVGNELDEAGLSELKKVSSDGKVRMRAYEWLLNRPHSTRELRDYLRRKKVEPDLSERLISEFTEKSVLDDSRFAEWFTERAQRKHKSVRMTRNELRGKGIIADSLPTNTDKESLEVLIAKLAGRPRYSDQARLIRYLQSKGFSYGDIKEALMLREPLQDGEI